MVRLQFGHTSSPDQLAHARLVLDRQARPQTQGEWYDVGTALLLLGRYREARRCLDQAHSMDPEDIGTNVNLALAFIQLNQLERALAHADRALAVDPEYLDALHTRATCLMALKQFEESIVTFDRILADYPDDADTIANKAEALRLGRGPGAASAFLETVLAAHPRMYKAWFILALVTASLGDGERCQEALDKTVEYGQDDPAHMALVESVVKPRPPQTRRRNLLARWLGL